MRARAAVLVGLMLIAPACSKASNETASDFEPAEDPGAVVFADSSPDVTATPVPAATKAASTSTGTSRSAPAAAPAPAQEGRISCPVGPVVAEVTNVTSDETTPDPDDPPPPPGQDLWHVRVQGTAQNKANGPVNDVVVRVEIRPSGSDGETESAYLSGPFGPGSVVQWTVTEEVYSEDDVEANDVRASVRSWSWGDRAKDANCGH